MSDDDSGFELLLEYLKQARGFDFTGYKPASVMRRVDKRMQSVGIDSYADYLDYLEVHPEEFSELFNTILINVTGFFRDAFAWDHISSHIIPRILAKKRTDEPLRVWSAGCSSGEEAYTLVMAMAEIMGADQFRERVKVYATDMDEDALTRARAATYTEKEIVNIPSELLGKYFEAAEGRYTFRKDLRRCVIFGRHDLIQDAPISRIDLLVCRNVLMYFNSETQSRIMARFHFALNDSAYLFLGRAEMLFTHASTFTPIDLKRRIFARLPKPYMRDHLLLMTQGQRSGLDDGPVITNNTRLRESAFDAGPVATIVVEPGGRLIMANELVRNFFGLTLQDVGRPLQELEISYRPVELRSAIDTAYTGRRKVTMKEVAWSTVSGEARWIDVNVAPLEDMAGNILGVSVTFTDVTRYKRLQEELERSNQELETAYEELQSTNEELETTNEELQSTVEELETTNEELQSTNEELETMNEELQSTNEELQTINDEFSRRSDELHSVNNFLGSILTSLRDGVVVLDSNLQVLIWNRRSEDLWGLRFEEVKGKNFMILDIGLAMEPLKQPVRAALAGEEAVQEIVLDAINRKGRSIKCKTLCVPLIDTDGKVNGAILLMEELHLNA